MLALRENSIFARRPEDAQRELKQRTAITRRAAKRQTLSKLQSRNAVAEMKELPGPGESLHIVCRGNFPLWSIVPGVLALAKPAIIEQLSIATLGFSKSNVADLLALFDQGQISAVSIVASVYFERQNPAEYKQMADGLKVRGQRIAALRSHAKIIAMALSDGRRFTVESSANLRSCRNLEQIAMHEGDDLYQFHSGWIAEVIEASSAKPQKARAPKPKSDRHAYSQKRASLGVWAATISADDRAEIIRWKSSGKATPADKYAHAVVETIHEWSPVLPPGACITAPPQGASFPGHYFAA